MHMHRLTAVAGLFALASFAQAQNANLLWYDKPATDWEKEALPIGNGRMGAMVFGGVDSERLQISEKSLWTGGPGSDGGYDFGLPAESQAGLMRSIGKQLADGAQLKPEDVAGHIKLADLAAAIIQDLGGADGPADELVEVFGRFILAVDLRIADEGHRGAHHFQSISQFMGRCRRRDPHAPAKALRAGKVGGVRQHD